MDNKQPGASRGVYEESTDSGEKTKPRRDVSHYGVAMPHMVKRTSSPDPLASPKRTSPLPSPRLKMSEKYKDPPAILPQTMIRQSSPKLQRSLHSNRSLKSRKSSSQSKPHSDDIPLSRVNQNYSPEMIRRSGSLGSPKMVHVAQSSPLTESPGHRRPSRKAPLIPHHNSSTEASPEVLVKPRGSPLIHRKTKEESLLAKQRPASIQRPATGEQSPIAAQSPNAQSPRPSFTFKIPPPPPREQLIALKTQNEPSSPMNQRAWEEDTISGNDIDLDRSSATSEDTSSVDSSFDITSGTDHHDTSVESNSRPIQEDLKQPEDIPENIKLSGDVPKQPETISGKSEVKKPEANKHRSSLPLEPESDDDDDDEATDEGVVLLAHTRDTSEDELPVSWVPPEPSSKFDTLTREAIAQLEKTPPAGEDAQTNTDLQELTKMLSSLIADTCEIGRGTEEHCETESTDEDDCIDSVKKMAPPPDSSLMTSATQEDMVASEDPVPPPSPPPPPLISSTPSAVPPQPSKKPPVTKPKPKKSVVDVTDELQAKLLRRQQKMEDLETTEEEQRRLSPSLTQWQGPSSQGFLPSRPNNVPTYQPDNPPQQLQPSGNSTNDVAMQNQLQMLQQQMIQQQMLQMQQFQQMQQQMMASGQQQQSQQSLLQQAALLQQLQQPQLVQGGILPLGVVPTQYPAQSLMMSTQPIMATSIQPSQLSHHPSGSHLPLAISPQLLANQLPLPTAQLLPQVPYTQIPSLLPPQLSSSQLLPAMTQFQAAQLVPTPPPPPQISPHVTPPPSFDDVPPQSLSPSFMRDKSLPRKPSEVDVRASVLGDAEQNYDDLMLEVREADPKVLLKTVSILSAIDELIFIRLRNLQRTQDLLIQA